MKNLLNLLVALTGLIASIDALRGMMKRYGPGFYNIDLSGRFINDSLATLEATKHKVSIRRKLIDSYTFGIGQICGGSLIRSDVVLTAAHCFVSGLDDKTFRPKEDYLVVMGNLGRFEKKENTVNFGIKEMRFALLEFDKSTYDKDIALLFLEGAVPIGHPSVQPIQMTDVEFPAGTLCQLIGWGITENSYATEFLRTTDVPLISKEVCRKDTDFLEKWIKDGMMCAGYLEGERYACSGDSGGPLVCQKLLAGIVSWGIGCANAKLPGVYTDVAYWRNWIDFQINDYNRGDIGSGDGSGVEDIGSGDCSGEGCVYSKQLIKK